MLRKYLFFIIFLFAYSTAKSQSIRPEVIFQSGFLNNVEVTFNFSKHGKYLTGLNGLMEYIVWDAKTGRQIKRFGKEKMEEIPLFGYEPNYMFSEDENQLLIPNFPIGNYTLFDIVQNKNLFVLAPNRANQWFTNAQFSTDGTKILVLGQSPGIDHKCELYVYDRSGKVLSVSSLEMPPIDYGSVDLIMKVFFRRLVKGLDKTSFIQHITYDDNLNKAYIAAIDGKVYSLNLEEGNHQYLKNDLLAFSGLSRFFAASQISLYKQKLIIKGVMRSEKLDSIGYDFQDTLFIANTSARRVEKKVVSHYPALINKFRSSGLNAAPILTNQNMSTYSSFKRTGKVDYELTVNDILSDEQIFSYKRGQLHGFNAGSTYHPGEFNGGHVVAISPDHQMMAECSLDLVIHNLQTRQIQSYTASAKGQMKVGAPLYLDSTKLLIPKAYNDAFIFDTKSGSMDYLKRDVDYQDTASNGESTYFSYHQNAQIGIQNASFEASSGHLATVELSPAKKSGSWMKILNTWDINSLTKLESFEFEDQEVTMHMNMIQGYPKRFLLNEKLLNFEDGKLSSISLNIKQRRDTFWAINPTYLLKEKVIFAVTSVRSLDGNPDLHFSRWDLNGKHISTHIFKREKTKVSYQSIITESILSPDSSKVLFTLFDGTIGIYDLLKNVVSSTYEHGKYFEFKAAKTYTHTRAYSACFIDENHFVTAGDDSRIMKWTVGNSKSDGVLNTQSSDFISLTLSPNRKHIVGVDFNKTVHFINLATGINDLNFIATNREAYTLVNDDGYYMTNKKTANDLSFLYNGKAYAFSQFDVALNRPDHVMQSLRNIDRDELGYLTKAWERRVVAMGYDPYVVNDLKTLDAPEIELVDVPELGLTTSKEILNFGINPLNMMHPPFKLLINVNGVPIYGANGKVFNKQTSRPVLTSTNKSKSPVAKKTSIAKVRSGFVGGGIVNTYAVNSQPAIIKKTSTEGTIPVSIPLSSGRNAIEISVVNSLGVESLQQTLNVQRAENTTKPNLYLLIVAYSKYTDETKNLKYAAKDARDIAALFLQHSAKFQKVFLDTFINKTISPVDFQKFKSNLQTSHPDDQVIVYYAGHGVLDQNLNYYLSTTKTNFIKPQQQSISYETFSNLIDDIPARNRLMLLDACYSAEVDKTWFSSNSSDDQERIFSLHKQLFSDLRRSNGASEIGASGPAEQALETSELQNGVFTYFLKKGLRESLADIDHDGIIKVSELAEYLRKEVSAYAEKAKLSQQPTFRKQNIINDMVLWKN